VSDFGIGSRGNFSIFGRLIPGAEVAPLRGVEAMAVETLFTTLVIPQAVKRTRWWVAPISFDMSEINIFGICDR
jgi:hypothetical protein